MNNQLPDKPSDLLALALSDLAKIERSSKYEVVMGGWHVPSTGDVCEVCMAGAVMAKTLKADRFKRRTPAGFETDTQNKLMALDDFRTGDLTHALKALGIRRPRSLASKIWVARYDTDRKLFKKDMQDIIEALKGEGL